MLKILLEAVIITGTVVNIILCPIAFAAGLHILLRPVISQLIICAIYRLIYSNTE